MHPCYVFPFETFTERTGLFMSSCSWLGSCLQQQHFKFTMVLLGTLV